MTYILIAINICIYVVMQTHGGPTFENLLLFGAKENGLIADGEVGRLFFPIFLHASLIHLGFNMYGLYQVGRYLEMIAGPRNLVVFYLVSGVCGNLCSFALSPALSVGASGSLFGILLGLYVFQKYEERLAEEANETPAKTTLGSIILINAVISFVIPNIDWASHMGGAISGSLLGMGLIMRHRWNLRVIRAVRYLGANSGLGKPSLVEREGFYYAILTVICLGFAGSVMRLGLPQKAFGRGVRGAAENFSEKRETDFMVQFRLLLSSPKSDTNPERMVDGAKRLHSQKHFQESALVYSVLLEMNRKGLGGSDFVSASVSALLLEAFRAAQANMPLPEAVAQGLTFDVKNADSDSDICKKPASLFKSLGFFELSGRLYACAFLLDGHTLEMASETIESFWLADNKREVFRFLDYLERSESQGVAGAGRMPMPGSMSSERDAQGRSAPDASGDDESGSSGNAPDDMSEEGNSPAPTPGFKSQDFGESI